MQQLKQSCTRCINKIIVLEQGHPSPQVERDEGEAAAIKIYSRRE